MFEPRLGKLYGFAKEFAKLSPIRSLFEIFGTWFTLLMTIGICLAWPHPIFYCIAFFIIASRQYALMILMHDGFHSLLHPNRKINHFISCVLLAYPCGSTFWIGRKSHLIHHATLGQRHDPDRELYISQGKQSFSKLLLFFVKLPLGEQIKRTYGIKQDKHISQRRFKDFLQKLANNFFYILPVAIYQLFFLGIFYACGSLLSYFVLWLFPLFLTIVFNGIRVFCEHGNPADFPGEKPHRLISYTANPIELFFIAPFHMNYHAEHHLFPYVPHHQLSSLRRKIRMQSPLNQVIQWRYGYFSFLKYFLRETIIISKVIADERNY